MSKELQFKEYEKALNKKGFSFVCGVDEVGRGPWAGPIVAAAVIIKVPNFELKDLGINDSKKLTEKKREELFEILTNDIGIDYFVSWVSAKVIDKNGLGKANQTVLRGAVDGLRKKIGKIDFVLVDGLEIKSLETSQESIIGGDERVLSIAVASIIAKVSRDRYMRNLARKYPEYGFEKHKGYGTRLHRDNLKKFGICPEHRKSFKPINKIQN